MPASDVRPVLSEDELEHFYSGSFFDFPLAHDVRYQVRLAVYSLLRERLLLAAGGAIEHLEYPSKGNLLIRTKSMTLDTWVNVSYSGSYVMCGISDCPIGVDVQRVRKVTDYLLDAITTQRERAFIQTYTSIQRCQLFSLKESYGKALQSGIIWPSEYPEYSADFQLLSQTYSHEISEAVVVDDKNYVASMTLLVGWKRRTIGELEGKKTMSEQDKIAKLEDMMDLDEGDLSADTQLADLEEWDSMSKLSLVVLAKKDYGKDLAVEDVRSFKTVGDICAAL